MTPLCPYWEAFPSGAQGLASSQVPYSQPGGTGLVPRSSQLWPQRGASPPHHPPHLYIPFSRLCCSRPQTCRLRLCALGAGAALGPRWGIPAGEDLSAGLGCCLGTHTSTHVPIPGQLPPAALSLPWALPSLPPPFPQPRAGNLGVSLSSPFSFTLHV